MHSFYNTENNDTSLEYSKYWGNLTLHDKKFNINFQDFFPGNRREKDFGGNNNVTYFLKK